MSDNVFNDRRKKHIPLGRPGEAGSSIRGVSAQGFQHVVRQTPAAASAATDPAGLAQHIHEHHRGHGVGVQFRVKDSANGKKGEGYFVRMGADTAAARHDQWHRDNKDHAHDHTH